MVSKYHPKKKILIDSLHAVSFAMHAMTLRR